MDADKLGGCFDRYLVMSPNVHTDPNYTVLARYIEKTTGQTKEKVFFDEWDPQVITDTMAEMRKANAYVRKNHEKHGFTQKIRAKASSAWTAIDKVITLKISLFCQVLNMHMYNNSGHFSVVRW